MIIPERFFKLVHKSGKNYDDDHDNDDGFTSNQALRSIEKVKEGPLFNEWTHSFKIYQVPDHMSYVGSCFNVAFPSICEYVIVCVCVYVFLSMYLIEH